MSRQKSGEYNDRSYQNEYHRNMKKVLLQFNVNNVNDMKIWDHLELVGSGKVSPYIKRLILEEMEREEKEKTEEKP